MSHISPDGPRRRAYRLTDATALSSRPLPVVTLAGGGCLLRVQGPCVPRETRQTWNRGVVTGFSRASRKRLMETLAKVDQQQLRVKPLFLTLTYPGEYSEDPAIWKRDHDTFLKRLARKHPEASAIWRLEFQKRGAPHFHLLLFNVKWLDKKWVSKCWYQIVGSLDKRHENAGTRIERVRTWRGVMWYASKYMAKRTDGGAERAVGRLWGIHNKAALPIAVVVFAITLREFWRLKRTARAYLAKFGTISPSNVWSRGFTIFKDTRATGQLLRSIGRE